MSQMMREILEQPLALQRTLAAERDPPWHSLTSRVSRNSGL
jgi:hypothetical protein